MKHFLLPTLSFMCCVSTFAAENDFPKAPAPLEAKCVAHRGFSRVAPENTLASIRMAVEAGANGAEMDVYVSRDGVPFLMHDVSMKRTAGLDAPLTACDADFIKTLDAGAWKAAKYRGERIPTLAAALALLKDTACVSVIEMKDGLEIVEKVLAEIKTAGLLERAVVIDFNAARLKKMRELAPEIHTAWLCKREKNETDESLVARVVRTLKDCRTNVVDMDHRSLTPAVAAALTAENITVWCWTVNIPADMRRLLDMGVRSITTDSPDSLLELIIDN